MLSMSLSEAAGKIPCTERWLADNLRAGKFPGHKIARQWRLTDDDVTTILEICSVNPAPPFSADFSVGFAPSSSMTKTTLRRLQQSSHPPERSSVHRQVRWHPPQQPPGERPWR